MGKYDNYTLNELKSIRLERESYNDKQKGLIKQFIQLHDESDKRDMFFSSSYYYKRCNELINKIHGLIDISELDETIETLERENKLCIP